MIKKNSLLKIAPVCPKCLTGLAAEHWNEYVPILIKDKVLCKIDIPILTMACQCYETSQTAEKLADRFKAQSQYLALMSKYGATYQSRVKLEIDDRSKTTSKKEDDDKFMEYD